MPWRRLISPLLLLLLWEAAARAQWIDAKLIPAPSTILWELWRLASGGELLRALAASLYRVVAGFAIAAAVGIVLGAQIPTGWALDFTLALTFIALVVPALKDRPSVAAALTAGAVAVAVLEDWGGRPPSITKSARPG